MSIAHAYAALAFGAVVLASSGFAPAPAFAAATPRDAALTIATWNIAWLRSVPLDAAGFERCRSMPADLRERLDDLDPARWVCRSAEHYAALGAVAARMDADIVALQEVESVEAIERVFPKSRYRALVTDGPWIQRTGYAVRRDRVEVIDFGTYRELGLPLGDARPRFGADLTIRQSNGRPLRLLNVHLKSACHAQPLTDTRLGRRDKPGDTPACQILANQLKPLEAWIDARAREKIDFIVLGDFNRRFDAPAEREPGAPDPQGRPVAMWRTLDDGDPPGARLVRLTDGRRQIRNCQSGDRGIPEAEREMFIDHVIVARSIAPRVADGSFRQWPMIEGRINRENRPFLRSLSDHCPVSVQIRD